MTHILLVGFLILIVAPITILTGFSSGMVGVSGGSFLVPLMVLAARVPMHTAVGTASTLIAATAFMGFTGHALQGDFNPMWAVPLAVVTIAGGIIGGKFALKTKPKPFEFYTAEELWTNHHTAEKMLAYHLDETLDAASRTRKFIDTSAEWIMMDQDTLFKTSSDPCVQ